MKLLFLGVFYAFTVGNNKFQANMMLESKSGKKMLIDAGGDVRNALYAQGYSYTDIDAVYISHLHADHIGGLEWLGYSKYFNEQTRPALYISADQKNKLWDNVLSGGMSTLEDQKASLDTFFDAKKIHNNTFIWEGYTFQLIKTFHSQSCNQILPSYGLTISGGIKNIFLTTDARFQPDDFKALYEKADIILQDCETSKKISGQHAHYNDLVTLDSTIKNKMWLYDYSDGALPDAKKDGFKGFVTQGQCFDF